MQLLVKSFEGDIYLAYRVDGKKESLIRDEMDRAITFRSLNQVRDYCADEVYQSATLQHACVYDEMCGGPVAPVSEMEIDLNWY